MLVNFGGDIYALGTKPDGSAFNIAVLDPRTARPHFRAVPLTGSAHDFGSQWTPSAILATRPPLIFCPKRDVERKSCPLLLSRHVHWKRACSALLWHWTPIFRCPKTIAVTSTINYTFTKTRSSFIHEVLLPTYTLILLFATGLLRNKKRKFLLVKAFCRGNFEPARSLNIFGVTTCINLDFHSKEKSSLSTLEPSYSLPGDWREEDLLVISSCFTSPLQLLFLTPGGGKLTVRYQGFCADKDFVICRKKLVLDLPMLETVAEALVEEPSSFSISNPRLRSTRIQMAYLRSLSQAGRSYKRFLCSSCLV